MIRLRLFGPEPYTDDWYHQFLNWNYGKYTYKDLEIVTDNSFTHVALFGLPRPNISHIPKENVVGFTPEPYYICDLHSYLDYATKYIGTYYCHDIIDLPGDIFKEYIPFLAPTPLQCLDPSQVYEKKYVISIIASFKQQSDGHKLRHEIIRRILRTNMDIHIYGRHIENFYRDSRVRGTLENKSVALIPYHYTISIENTKHKYYVTEKFYDPILFDCIPLYWGAPKVDEVFTNESHITLPDNIDHIFEMIVDVYNNPARYYKKTEVVKYKILNYEVNLASFLWKHFNGSAK
jgi:hypothetical protein